MDETRGREAPAPVRPQNYVGQRRYNSNYIIALGKSRGKGVGTEATWLILDYDFHLTNLHSVYLTVIKPSTCAIRAYEKANFKCQGLSRNSNQWLSETANEVLMDTIPEDFEGPPW